MKVLFVSQFIPFGESGISRQGWIIAQYLHKLNIEVEFFSWESKIVHPFSKNGQLVYPINYLPARIRKDCVVLFYGEHWAIPAILHDIAVPILWYIPIDSPSLPSEFTKVATMDTDLIIPVTEFGKTALQNANLKHLWLPIPHTVLLTKAKEDLFEKDPNLTYIGVVLRPQRRKNIWGLIKCLEQIDNYHLVVVSDEHYREMSLSDAFNQFDIPYTLLDNINSGKLASFYRTIDLYLTTTEAEGFGIPSFEAVFAKRCVLGTDLPVFREFGFNDANLIKIKKTISLPNECKWNMIDEKDFLVKYNALKEKNFPSTEINIAPFIPNTVGPQWAFLFENLGTILAHTE